MKLNRGRRTVALATMAACSVMLQSSVAHATVTCSHVITIPVNAGPTSGTDTVNFRDTITITTTAAGSWGMANAQLSVNYYDSAGTLVGQGDAYTPGMVYPTSGGGVQPLTPGTTTWGTYAPQLYTVAYYSGFLKAYGNMHGGQAPPVGHYYARYHVQALCSVYDASTSTVTNYAGSANYDRIITIIR